MPSLSSLQTAFCCFYWGCNWGQRYCFSPILIRKINIPQKINVNKSQYQWAPNNRPCTVRTPPHSFVQCHNLWTLLVVSLMHSQPKGITLKLRRACMIAQCELSRPIKAKGIKQTNKKQRLPLQSFIYEAEIAQSVPWSGDRTDNQEITVKFPGGPTDFSLLYIVQFETDESSPYPLILHKIHFNSILPPKPQFTKTPSGFNTKTS